MTGHAIVVDDLVVERGRTVVLPGTSASIERGKITGLLGPSGSGKSTLIRSIVGVQKVRSGTVTVLDVPAGSPSLRSRVGYVTQAPSVYSDITVYENLRYFAAILDVEREQIDRVLETVGLTTYADRRVDQLSGGQRARVSLATALLNEPEVLVLDEPTVGLDPVLRQDLWQTFHALAQTGVTLLVSSHVMDEATRCHQLLLMREGRILAHGSPDELCSRTHTNDIEAAFLTLVDAPEHAE